MSKSEAGLGIAIIIIILLLIFHGFGSSGGGGTSTTTTVTTSNGSSSSTITTSSFSGICSNSITGQYQIIFTPPYPIYPNTPSNLYATVYNGNTQVPNLTVNIVIYSKSNQQVFNQNIVSGTGPSNYGQLSWTINLPAGTYNLIFSWSQSQGSACLGQTISVI